MGKIPYVESASHGYGIMYAMQEAVRMDVIWFHSRTARDIAFTRMECGLPVLHPDSDFFGREEWILYPAIFTRFDSGELKVRQPEVPEEDVKTIRERELSRMRLDGTIPVR